MQLTTVFACVSLVISAAAAAQSDYTVACYVDSATRRLFHHVSPSVCTHLVYTSAYIDENSSFKTAAQDPNTGCTSIKTLKERYSTLKALLGVEVKQSRLEQLTQNKASLDSFIDATLKHLKEKNYDGLEMTWVENTASEEPSRSTETLAQFLKELKRQIGEDAELANQSVLVLVSLPARTDHTSAHSDEKAISQFVDFITLLPSSLVEESQIDSAVKYWQEQGVDPQQLIVALPAFLWRSRRREHRRRFDTVNVTPEKMEQPYGPGLMIAKQVCQAIKSGQTELKTLTKLESTQSLGEEVSWLLQKGVGGVGVVALDVDNFAESMCLNCTESEKALLESKTISVPPHHHHHPHGHSPHSRHGHHRGPHHHHPHDREGREPHGQDGASFDANDTGHRHGHRHGRHHHEHHHGHGHHGHGHHGRGGHGERGPYGHHGERGHEGHSHDHHRRHSTA
ncbi:histidine-rich carboxyl terminus protein 1 isoform X1 [Astyanax mexicanus]|uniref:histidine-rich carboxyl terminus protein 1 isoform X1 n=1 Tax=Astyanax mexicanus TaxID=7994 RepID=UPI0020CAA9F4|nr:histidine-rich carboxyl terminus protein 1 isoform X1 [Astyanax mexicanus]